MLGLLVVGGGLAWYFGHSYFQRERADLLLHTVRREPLEVTVVERGQLEAADNKDVVCLVKAGARGSQIASTIKWVIDDGTHVKQGDLLVELDKSGLEDQERSQQIAVDTARAAMVTAEGQLVIVKSENDSDLNAALNTLELARIDLDKFVKGEYLQQLSDVQGRVKKAESDLEMIRDRSSWSDRMVMKKYLSASQAESDQAKLMGAELDLKKVREEERVLTQFTKRRTETDLTSKLKEAERALDRAREKNKAKLNTAESDVKTKKSLLEQELAKLKEFKDQIALCTLTAPGDGMAVYYVSDQMRSGFGSQQSSIAQGEPVREGQRIIRIPNLDSMLVNTRVHEVMSSKLKAGMRVDIHIDAFPDRVLKAHVKSVATIALQNDWRSADVKMYQTMIAIDDKLPGLKPGMSAECSIYIDATSDPVLAVPVQAIVGGAEMGAIRRCFVKTATGVDEREIVVGLTNEKLAEIKSGLKEGEEVVLNPKVLIGDKAKTRSATDFEAKEGGGGKGKAFDKMPEGKAPGGPAVPVAPPAGAPAMKGGPPSGGFDPGKMKGAPPAGGFDPSKMKGTPPGVAPEAGNLKGAGGPAAAAPK